MKGYIFFPDSLAKIFAPYLVECGTGLVHKSTLKKFDRVYNNYFEHDSVNFRTALFDRPHSRLDFWEKSETVQDDLGPRTCGARSHHGYSWYTGVHISMRCSAVN